MKDKNRTKQFVLSFFCLVGLFQMVQAQVTPKSLEYWLDTNFAQRSSVATTGSLSQNIDVSTLRPGIHTLAVRVSDTKGRWGAPLLKYFLIGEKSITQNKLTSYEYCFDGNWDASVSGNFDKELSLNISLEGLREGLHHLLLRVTDEEGRISQTVLKNFLVYGEDPKERELTSYKYWIDEFDEAVKGVTSDGNVALDIDVSSLNKGLHTLGYQIGDNKGRWSAPRLLYFIVPEMEVGTDKLVAYEYWFNRGPRTRVQTTENKLLTLSNVMIEVKDVIPNYIPSDYTFDVKTESVSCQDNVFFGMQVFNAANQASLAVLSDSFLMTVPIDPHFLPLNNEEKQTFAAPTTGLMQGLKTLCSVGDSLIYTLSAQGVQADFYDANGNRLEVEIEENELGETIYELAAKTNKCYVLLYGAPDVMNELSMSLCSTRASSINDLANDLFISTSKQKLHVESMSNGSITIYSVSGKNIVSQRFNQGKTTFSLPSGVYLVQVNKGKTIKVLVP